jgi:hypothetical protein
VPAHLQTTPPKAPVTNLTHAPPPVTHPGAPKAAMKAAPKPAPKLAPKPNPEKHEKQ